MLETGRGGPKWPAVAQPQGFHLESRGYRTKRMQRRTFLITMPLAVASLLGGCRAQAQRIRVAYHPWVGYETLLLASQFDWLPATASLRRLESATGSLAALRGGQVDAAALTLDEVIRARLGGLDLVVVMVFDVSSGGDVVMAREGIDTPADLAGKRIAVELGGVGEMLLDQVLARAGLDRDDVVIVDLAVDQHLVAWGRGEIDAAVGYEPTATRLRDAGAQRLIDSRDFPDMIFDVLAVRRDRLDAVDHVLTEVIRAHFRGLHHLRTNRQDAVYRIADAQQVSERVVNWSIAGVLLPGLEANRRYLARNSRLFDAVRYLTPRLSSQAEPPSPSEVEEWIIDAYLPREPRQ